MKRKIIFLAIMLSVLSFVFGGDYSLKKIQEYSTGTYNEGLFIRKYEQVAPQDDISKNYLVFTRNGDLCIYQADSSRMIYLNDNLKIEKEICMNLLIHAYDLMYTDNNLLMTDKIAKIYLFDIQLQLKAYFELYDIFSLCGQGVCLTSTYYDEASDIIFFKDTDDNLHSIIHPCLNDEENRKNYKNPEETLKLFENETIINNTGIRVTKSESLFINGKYTYWGQHKIGNFVYQITSDDCLVYESQNVQNNFYVNILDENGKEEKESVAIHPSGDIYILRMNWETNTHNLYRVENTWDPQWRKEWYENHKSESVSQNILSTNVAVNKEMTCSDNLRLRSEEATTSRVITTMQKGTKVKILKLGKAETIDGITSNWVQVEVLSGSKDKDGKALKAGTIGWCYGGYLE